MNLNLVKIAREAGFHVGDQFAAGCSEDDLQKMASSITEEFKTLEPPQRTWVGLTDEEILGALGISGSADADYNAVRTLNDARKLEAKLKEKNA